MNAATAPNITESIFNSLVVTTKNIGSFVMIGYSTYAEVGVKLHNWELTHSDQCDIICVYSARCDNSSIHIY